LGLNFPKEGVWQKLGISQIKVLKQKLAGSSLVSPAAVPTFRPFLGQGLFPRRLRQPNGFD